MFFLALFSAIIIIFGKNTASAEERLSFHTISRQVRQDVTPDLSSNIREHCPGDKVRIFEDEDGVTDCLNCQRGCEKLELAKEYFEATMYEEAIPIFEEYDDENVRNQLTQAYFFTNRDKNVVEHLQNQENLDEEERFFLAISYRNLKNYEKAIFHLNQIIDLENEEIIFELGKTYLEDAQYDKAQKLFQNLLDKESQTPFQSLAKLHLARIFLLKNGPDRALSLLDSCCSSISKDDFLYFELSFLKGTAFYMMGDFFSALEHFKRSLPKKNIEKAEWYFDTITHIAWSYLKLSESQPIYFKKAEDSFLKLYQKKKEENIAIEICQFYLLWAKQQQDENVYEKALNWLEKTGESKLKMALKCAEYGPSYEKRDQVFHYLCENYSDNANIWYLKGINDFEQDPKLAAECFEIAFQKLTSGDQPTSHKGSRDLAQTLMMQIKATEKGQNDVKALSLLEIMEREKLYQELDKPDEVFYLKGLIAIKLGRNQESDENFIIAEKALEKGIDLYPKGSFFPEMEYLLGILFFEQGKYQKALNIFQKVKVNTLHYSDSLFWMAHCSEFLNGCPTEAKKYRKQLFKDYPNSQYAAEAYFLYFDYREYIQGNRSAMKHLQKFQVNFPDSPYLINAFYLLGMDYKRDRKSDEGKWIRKKNLNAAIEAFQKVEIIFDQLVEKRIISNDKISYFTNVKYRSMLEKGLANFTVAKESKEAKKEIYLDYSKEIFNQICEDLKNLDHPLRKGKSFPKIYEESSYWLAKTYLCKGQESKAEKIFKSMLDKYTNAKITRGYFLSKVWYELGLIVMNYENYELALKYFKKSEDTAKGKVLGTDEKLNLTIIQSECYRKMQQMDKAMLILSNVINENVISGLRLKAMYLRAEIYEMQGRDELARKQLEATAMKGGIWGKKARQKLDEYYGYQ